MNSYQISGFNVHSEIDLPCDPRFTTKNFNGHINVLWREKPFDVNQVVWIAHRPWARAYDVGDGVLISIQKNLQSYIKASGDTIMLHFDRSNLAHCGMAGANTINLGLAACSLLRGDLLPLHAASVFNLNDKKTLLSFKLNQIHKKIRDIGFVLIANRQEKSVVYECIQLES